MFELILIFIAGWMVIGWLMRSNRLNKQKERENKRRLPCPHCAEHILPEAKVCPHCQRDVATLAVPKAPWGPRPPTDKPAASRSNSVPSAYRVALDPRRQGHTHPPQAADPGPALSAAAAGGPRKSRLGPIWKGVAILTGVVLTIVLIGVINKPATRHTASRATTTASSGLRAAPTGCTYEYGGVSVQHVTKSGAPVLYRMYNCGGDAYRVQYLDADGRELSERDLAPDVRQMQHDALEDALGRQPRSAGTG